MRHYPQTPHPLTREGHLLRNAERMANNTPPAWYLDAMREGCAPVCWELADWRDKIVARIKYFFRS